MMIQTSSGKTFEARWCYNPTRRPNTLVIECTDKRKLYEIAADFDGQETIIKTDSARPSMKEVYEGFNSLAAIQRDTETGVVRLTLEKDDAA